THGRQRRAPRREPRAGVFRILRNVHVAFPAAPQNVNSMVTPLRYWPCVHIPGTKPKWKNQHEALAPAAAIIANVSDDLYPFRLGRGRVPLGVGRRGHEVLPPASPPLSPRGRGAGVRGWIALRLRTHTTPHPRPRHPRCSTEGRGGNGVARGYGALF